jgi:hypothetical protein
LHLFKAMQVKAFRQGTMARHIVKVGKDKASKQGKAPSQGKERHVT